MALETASGTEVGQKRFEPCAGWPTSQWGENAVARGRETLHIDPLLEGGFYTVTLTLVDRLTGAPATRPLAIGQVEIQGELSESTGQ